MLTFANNISTVHYIFYGVLCFSASCLQCYLDAQEVLPRPGWQRTGSRDLSQVGQTHACLFFIIHLSAIFIHYLPKVNLNLYYYWLNLKWYFCWQVTPYPNSYQSFEYVRQCMNETCWPLTHYCCDCASGICMGSWSRGRPMCCLEWRSTMRWGGCLQWSRCQM